MPLSIRFFIFLFVVLLGSVFFIERDVIILWLYQHVPHKHFFCRSEHGPTFLPMCDFEKSPSPIPVFWSTSCADGFSLYSVNYIAKSLLENVYWITGLQYPLMFAGNASCHPPTGFLMIALQSEAESGNDVLSHFPYNQNSKLVLGTWYTSTKQNASATHWASYFIPHASLSFTEGFIFTPYHLLHRKYGAKPYLIAYNENNCNSLGQILWDLIVDKTTSRGLGAARALGKCYGSRKHTSRFIHSEWPISGWKDENSMMGTAHDKRVQSLSDFRFVLVVQDPIRHVGYVTRMISDAFLSGAIPLFVGDRQVAEIYNLQAMILLDVENLTSTLESFISIASDSFQYENKRRLPVLSKEQACQYFSWHRALSFDCQYVQHQLIISEMERLLANQGGMIGSAMTFLL